MVNAANCHTRHSRERALDQAGTFTLLLLLFIAWLGEHLFAFRRKSA